MSEQQLREQLEQLRALVNEIGAERPDSLERLNRRVSDIEDRLADRGAARPDATDAVREAIRHFEGRAPAGHGGAQRHHGDAEQYGDLMAGGI